MGNLDDMLKMWNQLKAIGKDKDVEDSMGLFRRLLQFVKSARQTENLTHHDLLWPAYYNYYLQRQFPPKNGLNHPTFNKIEGIFNVLTDQANSPMKEFYTQQAIEFYLLDQRQKQKQKEEKRK